MITHSNWNISHYISFNYPKGFNKCLFVWGLSSHLGIVHSFGDVTITSEGLFIMIYSRHSIMAIEQWGFFNVPHLLWHGPILYNGHLQWSVTLTPCRTFGSGALTTCFNNLGLSRPGIELRFPACEANALPLRQCGGLFYKKTKLMNYMFVKYWFASMLQIRLVMIQNAFFIKDKKRSYNYTPRNELRRV